MRKDRLRVYDLAVPRDINPAAESVDGIILKNIDDLTSVFERRNLAKSKNISLASYLAAEAARHYEETSNETRIKGWHKTEPVSH